jgi:hypothetical protein
VSVVGPVFGRISLSARRIHWSTLECSTEGATDLLYAAGGSVLVEQLGLGSRLLLSVAREIRIQGTAGACWGRSEG